MRAFSQAVLLSLSVMSMYMAGCGTENDGTGPWNESDNYRWQTLARVRSGGPGFRSMPPARTGVTFSNTLSDAAIVENRHRMNGSGVALGDVNGDGLVDIYLAGIQKLGALYLNEGQWHFTDATTAAGLEEVGPGATGVVFVDLDGDRDLDLFITFLERNGEIFLNDGSAHFERSRASVQSGPAGMTATFADLDGDGDLDGYVTRYKSRAVRDSLPPDRLLWNRTVLSGPDGTRIAPGFETVYSLKTDGSRVVRLESGRSDILLLNTGNGEFESFPVVPPVAPVSDSGDNFADWGLTARLVDFTGDGMPDLYVCNDYESRDYIWSGDGKGGFTELDPVAIRTTSHSSMAVADADVDRDGRVDLFVADMLGLSAARRLREVQNRSPITPPPTEIEAREQSMRNTLLMGREDNTFSEVSWQYGLAASGWTWAASFGDIDLDGWEDLLMTTGHRFDVQDADAQLAERDQIRRVNSVEAYRNLILNYPDHPLVNRAYRNVEGNRFEDVTQSWGFGVSPDISHGLALGDLDGDGDLDAVVNRMNAPAGVFQNRATAPRLAVRLRGRAPNTEAIGAKIRLFAGERVQERRLVAGGGYLSSSVPEASFAIEGDNLKLEVRWPSGDTSRVDDVHPGRRYEIFEPWTIPAGGSTDKTPRTDESSPSRSGSAPPTSSTTTSTYFTSYPVGQHSEALFDDRTIQPLLTRRLSREGPGIISEDLNGDGMDDLVVAAGRGGRPEVLLGKKDGPPTVQKQAVSHLEIASGDWTGISSSRIGDELFILAAVSGYESEDNSELHIFVWRSDRLELVDRIDLGTASPGAIAVADIDEDGFLDIFVGNRFNPGAYPSSAPSMIYRYGNGSWSADSIASAVFTTSGSVTSADFGDSNGDGFPDLALATEWGPVRFFLNDGTGTLVERTAESKLGTFKGLWNAVKWVDVDLDGRDDLVAMNLGWNSPMGRDGVRRIYHGSFAADGVYRAIEAQYRSDLGDWGPTLPFDDALAGWPGLWRTVSSYSVWSTTKMNEIPGIFNAVIAEADYVTHTVFLNSRGGFRAVPLPDIVQRAPSHGVASLDANQDGIPDLVVAQNDFGVLPEGTSRYDSGRGLLLLGDGHGGFSTVTAAVSNIRVYGDQRGIATGDFNGDGHRDVAITQNSASTIVLLKNTISTDCQKGNRGCSP